LSGRILDVSTSKPLANVLVKWEGTSTQIYTDANGNFALPRMSRKLLEIEGTEGYGYENIMVEGKDQLIILLHQGKNNQANTMQGRTVTAEEMRGVSIGKAKAKARRKLYEFAADSAKNKTVENIERVQTATTQFDIELPYTIASDNRFYNVDVKTLQIPTTYTYYVVPKLDKDAFLFGEITDWEQYNLLAGESNVFFENTYVGKTVLNTDELGDTLRISLGRDKNIGVERTKMRDFSKRNFLGDRKSDSRAYEIKIRNKKKTPINLIVEDQIPLTTDKSIEIESEAKNAAIDAATGKVIWRINALKPSGEQKMQVQYTVRYPKNVVLNLN
jgi:uncharacterized protein (TIGR02231 family)